MKVLYVNTTDAPEPAAYLADVLRLAPEAEIHSVVGAAGALLELRGDEKYRAVFLAPSVPHNEALALISSLRRDRAPLAIVAIIRESDRLFFAHAMTAGADDVLVIGAEGVVDVEDTVDRIRHNRHTPLSSGAAPLRVTYLGNDEPVFGLVSGIPFVEVTRTEAADNGSVALEPADALIVDEQPGAAHQLQVVKWLKANEPGLPVIVLTAPAAGDVGGAALELGADEVVNKSGTYRRRLVASLHRLFLKKDAPAAAPGGRLFERIEALSEAAQSATIALTTLRAEHDQLRETLAFERAMRERDREEVALLTRELAAERERRGVIERTLNQAETAHEAERRQLQEDVAAAADRLHQVANSTQVVQARLERQLAEKNAERDRLTDNALVGHAVFTRGGRLVRCSSMFASLLGYLSPEEALEASAGKSFPGTPDHEQILRQLDEGAAIDRIESTLRRADGRPIRVLTAATLLSGAIPEDEPVEAIERLVVDLSDRRTAEVELQLARRLEAAGRLAAEMAPQIESALRDLERGDGEHRGRLALLVRQLLAFSRNQAKPAGYLSLNDAVSRLERSLRQFAGGAVDFEITLGDVEPVTAGEEDIEHLIVELVTSAAGSLPFGGRLTLTTASETHTTFVLRTALTVTAAGYGVLPCVTSPSLARHVARCGGTLQASGESGRTSTLQVFLPC